MRLLADENLPKPIVEALRAEGHDVLWACTDLTGAMDGVLLNLAESDARIVLTVDKDFRRIAVQRRSPLEQSGVVLFRVHPATPEGLAPLVRAFVNADTAWAGYIAHHGRRNSDGGCAQKVSARSQVFSSPNDRHSRRMNFPGGQLPSSQRRHRVHLRSPSRRHVAGNQRHRYEHQRHREVGRRICRVHLE